jgi:leader peptidase (prepilin peptidase)/N-methyltransferase
MIAELAPVLTIVTVLAAAFGLVIGSFLNVVVYRVPNGMSVVAPASACPECGHTISARDNVPVLSWLMLRGRCRNCKMGISARYPIVEAITGVLFVGVTVWMSGSIGHTSTTLELVSAILELVALLYFMAISVALTAIDLDVKRLPDRIVWPSYAVAGILLAASGILDGDFVALARAAAGAGILVAFYFLLVIIRPGGMGLGDVKLAGVVGLYLGFFGWQQLIVGALAAFLLGGVVGIVLMLTRRANRKSGIPFGPWMLGGAWVGIIAGPAAATAYLTIAGLN